MTKQQKTIEERIRAISASASASMVPSDLRASQDLIPPPPKADEVIPEIADMVPVLKDRLEILSLGQRSSELTAEIAPLEKEKKRITDKLKKLVGLYKIGRGQCEFFKLNYYSSPQSHVDSGLLKLNGVSAEIIDACTVRTEKYTLRITRPESPFESD